MRCKARPIRGEPWCYVHHPDLKDQRQAASRKGGHRGGRSRPQSGAAETRAIKADIQAVIDGVAQGTYETKLGTVLFMGYNTLLRAVEVGRKVKETDELEERLDALERRQSVETGVRQRSL